MFNSVLKGHNAAWIHMQKCAFVRKEEQFAISREIHEGVNFVRGEKENKIEGTLPFPLKVDGLF